jgi:hypothetical protein
MRVVIAEASHVPCLRALIASPMGAAASSWAEPPSDRRRSMAILARSRTCSTQSAVRKASGRVANTPELSDRIATHASRMNPSG